MVLAKMNKIESFAKIERLKIAFKISIGQSHFDANDNRWLQIGVVNDGHFGLSRLIRFFVGVPLFGDLLRVNIGKRCHF